MQSTTKTKQWALLLLLSPIWIFNLLTSVPNRGFDVSFYADPFSATAYPTIRGYRDQDPSTQLVVGDRIIQIGEMDVHGATQLGLFARTVAAAHASGGVVSFLVERDGQRLTLSESLKPQTRARSPLFVASIVYGLAAVLILWRAPPGPASRALFYSFLCYAALYSGAPATTEVQAWSAVLCYTVALLFAQPLLIRAFLSFPEEVNALRGMNRWWPWLFALVGPPFASARYGFPMRLDDAQLPALIGVIAFIVALLIIIGLNFRRSGPSGRRQIKWVLYGVYLGAVPSLFAFAVGGPAPVDPPFWWGLCLAIGASSFPVVVLISVLRSDFLDVDRLIGVTATYNLLLIGLIGAALVVAPRLTVFMSEVADVDPFAGQIGFALALAAALVPAQRWLSPTVHRLFFKERFALEQAMRNLPSQLAAARTAEELWQTTGRRLDELLHPTTCAIYSVVGNSFATVYARGGTVPPAIDTSNELVTAMAQLDGATNVRSSALRRLTGMARAVLDSLQSQVLIPITRDDQLESIISLGEKHSGDIYTNTDLTLLTGIANSLASHLVRFDTVELLERARATQDAMRKYVPGVVAEEILQGQSLADGERHVTVLFVDIRGYTAYTYSRPAEDIFSTLNQYTECVSRLVTENGGSVVEFKGAGMMAVFGAPQTLANKEAAAVRAARALIDAVPRLKPADGIERGLNIGAGIATGQAFVGNIAAVDRMIWSAIGNTTNLAARLQNMTRDLGAALIIDEATYRAAAGEVDGLVRTEKAIRGRSHAETIYLLPLAG